MNRAPLVLAAMSLCLAVGAGAETVLPIDYVYAVDDTKIAEGMPRTLAEFGFFEDDAARKPLDALVPYDLNTPLWSDGADKLRYIYVPDGARIEANGEGLLRFPIGSALIKTFAFGEGEEQRFIETRVLLHRADGWVALPYRWNEEQTEARLALAGGRVPVRTPAGESISYRIPNKNQCKACHGKDDAVIPIGPKARNLSPALIETLVATDRLIAAPAVAQRLPRWQDDSAATDALARAYLDVNCAHCHQPGGGASNSGLDLRWEQDDPHALGIDKPPVAAGRGAGGHAVSVAPGNPDVSILVYRMGSNEAGVAMPELGRASVDERAVAVMREWIEDMRR
ncbi:SO2930 family diheme c-type cytochrome [Erythrobacter sp.]|uniref:SO2930 family diheme c-type cytochrome n=1 Tax=Erythrobacter sp. TaxID=1042 RepID=UPI003C76AC5D